MTTVRFYAAARAAVGSSEISLEAGTLAELIQHCAAMSEQMSALISTCTFLVDGVSEGDLQRSLEGVRQVDVLPKFAGG